MRKEFVEKTINYWRITAKHDYKTMLGLFRMKHYSASLFFGHIILEKILKGLVVAETSKEAPYIHNLVELAKLAKLSLSEEDMDLLAEVNRFNIRTRYPDAKLRFYKQCTKDYTSHYLNKIKKLYKKLCQILKEKN